MSGNLEQIVCRIVHQHKDIIDAKKCMCPKDVIASTLIVLAWSLPQFWSGLLAFSQTLSRHSSVAWAKDGPTLAI